MGCALFWLGMGLPFWWFLPPAIYVNEWASFSTRDFPENRNARDGDRVRIVMLDVPDDDCPWRGIKHR